MVEDETSRLVHVVSLYVAVHRRGACIKCWISLFPFQKLSGASIPCVPNVRSSLFSCNQCHLSHRSQTEHSGHQQPHLLFYLLPELDRHSPGFLDIYHSSVSIISVSTSLCPPSPCPPCTAPGQSSSIRSEYGEIDAAPSPRQAGTAGSSNGLLRGHRSRVRMWSIGKSLSSETTSDIWTDCSAPLESINRPQACVLLREPLQHWAYSEGNSVIAACKECVNSSKERPGRQEKAITTSGLAPTYNQPGYKTAEPPLM